MKKYESKLLYSDVVESRKLKYGYKINQMIVSGRRKQEAKTQFKLDCIEPLPLTLKYLQDDADDINKSDKYIKNTDTSTADTNKVIHFPYQQETASNVVIETDQCVTNSCHDDDECLEDDATNAKTINEEVRGRWMTYYDNYNDSTNNDLLEEEEITDDEWKINYGTADPTSSISNVPCGGCGALLHCKVPPRATFRLIGFFKN